MTRILVGIEVVALGLGLQVTTRDRCGGCGVADSDCREEDNELD